MYTVITSVYETQSIEKLRQSRKECLINIGEAAENMEVQRYLDLKEELRGIEAVLEDKESRAARRLSVVKKCAFCPIEARFNAVINFKNKREDVCILHFHSFTDGVIA